MPDAARISDSHVCPKVEPGPVPHVGGPIFSGSANVIIGFLPAARVDDSVICFPLGPSDRIESGSTSVLINHRAAARKTDPCVHIGGDMIVGGCPTVIIGDSPQSLTFRTAARRGTPFCEECERKRKELAEHDRSDAGADQTPPDPDTATLDDDDPPPGAITGRDLLSGMDVNRQQLACQPDLGDGLDGERRAARVAIAFQFFAAHAGARIKPSRISSHIRAMDVSKAVEVIGVSGKTLYQPGVPGAGYGQYFTLTPDVIAHAVKDGEPLPSIPRDRRMIEFGDEPAYGLQSAAAAIPGTWSTPASATGSGQTVGGEGSDMQVMIPATFHNSGRTTLL